MVPNFKSWSAACKKSTLPTVLSPSPYLCNLVFLLSWGSHFLTVLPTRSHTSTSVDPTPRPTEWPFCHCGAGTPLITAHQAKMLNARGCSHIYNCSTPRPHTLKGGDSLEFQRIELLQLQPTHMWATLGIQLVVPQCCGSHFFHDSSLVSQYHHFSFLLS